MYLGPNICTFSCHGPTCLTLISHRFVKGHQGELLCNIQSYNTLSCLKYETKPVKHNYVGATSKTRQATANPSTMTMKLSSSVATIMYFKSDRKTFF